MALTELLAAKMTEYLTPQEAIDARGPNENAVVHNGKFWTLDANGEYPMRRTNRSNDVKQYAVIGDDRRLEAPVMTTLSFSGGRQSTWLLESLLRNEIERPENLLVVNADPGNEKASTYELIERYREKCAKADIDMRTADGPDLYKDLLDMQNGKKTRIDNPPLWTRKKCDDINYPEPHPTQGEVFSIALDAIENPGKYQASKEQVRRAGALAQCCTGHYKVAPIRRCIRTKLAEITGGRRVRPGIVNTWIGFAAHEWSRAEKAKEDVKWQRLSFPMIEMDVTANRVLSDWKRWELPPPAISMCNICPFQGMKGLKKMHDEQSDDWMTAVFMDRRLRKFTNAGVNSQVFVSQSLVPLEVLPILDFKTGDEVVDADLQCDSGLCFM